MRLDVPVKYVPFKSPGELADMAVIGAEPQRAATIAFTPAYAEIEATYLVPFGSSLKTIADVDSEGVRGPAAAYRGMPAAVCSAVRHTSASKAAID